jgi:rhodanese-related sulfurtransferase
MRIIFLSLALSLLFFGCKDASPAAANEKAPDEATEVEVPEISVEDADEAIQAGAIPVDANSEKTRKENGTVPGAVILTSSYKYDLAQLPNDKSKDLIFYCSNTKCTASDAAADRAASNGYKNVHIMREGIKGWKKAGKTTASYPRS